MNAPRSAASKRDSESSLVYSSFSGDLMAVTIFDKYSYLPSPEDMRKDPEMTCGAATLSFVANGLSINDNKFLRLIGEITIEWSKVERSIDEMIWDCLGVERKHGACVTAQYIGAGPRCRALSSLCGELGLTKEVCDDINLFKVSAQTVGEKRNRLVHDYWSATVGIDGNIITSRHEIKTEKNCHLNI